MKTLKRTSFLQSTAMALLFLLSFSVCAPVLAVSPAERGLPSAEIYKSIDIFNGCFSSKEVAAIPNEPFDVSFTICPTLDVQEATITFCMPADLVKLAEGDRIWTGNVGKGETLTLPLSFAVNGEVEAYIRADVEAQSSGTPYHSSYYLHVATPEAVFSADKGGMTRPVNSENILVEMNIESSRQLPESDSGQVAGTFRIYGRWGYTNELGGYSPGRYMLVEIWDEDTVGDDYLAGGWTNSTGHFDITAPNDDGWLGADPYIRYIAMGAWDWVSKTGGGDTYWWRYPSSGTIRDDVPNGWVYNAGSRIPVSGHEALQAGDAVYQEAQWIFNRVLWARPTRVTINWPYETWPHCHGDSIHMPSKATTSWDHITVHHEYGHSVMWTLYGNSWPEGTQGGTHWVYMEDVLPDAWVEGFAEFMQCVVDNNPNNLQSVGHNIETNDWYNHQDVGDMDGAYVEGEIASILWDIYDPTSASDKDYMSWGFEEIFTVVRYGDSGVDDNPNSAYDFWTDWLSRWPTVSTSAGPLSTIYWHYGINRDYYNPSGTITINAGAQYTKSRWVTLTLSASDWGSGVKEMRFSNDVGSTWSGWVAYATTYSYYMTKPGDGGKYVDVQFRDYAGRVSTYLGIFDYIILDTVAPVTTISHAPGSSMVSLSATDATSGISAIYYRIDLGSWITYVGPFTLTGTGTHTINYYSTDKAGNSEVTKTLKVHYLTVNTDPAGITTISGAGWYNEGTTATTGAAPATVTSGGVTYAFAAWKKDGTPVGGNPVNILMNAPHTATAAYVYFKIWTDKTGYKIGETMKVYVRVRNPGPTPLPVRARIFLKLPNGYLYGPLLDMKTTLPANYDSGTVLWNSFKIPSAPLGYYAWIAELRNPTTGALICQSAWSWNLAAAASTTAIASAIIARTRPE